MVCMGTAFLPRFAKGWPPHQRAAKEMVTARRKRAAQNGATRRNAGLIAQDCKDSDAHQALKPRAQ